MNALFKNEMLLGARKFFEPQNSRMAFELAILKKKCPICGIELIEKDGWIFCPANSTDAPECDVGYHIAKNIKNERGWKEIA